MSDDDDAALSHITSKMPAPPPRPPSTASSARSSRCSSTASSFQRLSKHAPIGAEGEPHDTPPTPSISSRYTNVTLFDEMASLQPQDCLSSATFQQLTERPAPTTSHRLSRIRSSSSGMLHYGKRRNSRAMEEYDQEEPSENSARSPSVTSHPFTKEHSTMEGPPLRSINVQKDFASIERFVGIVAPFALNILSAISSILSLVIWPIMAAVADTFAVHFTLTTPDVAEVIKDIPPKAAPGVDAIKSVEKAFAERFKYIICTSFLLTSSLSISSYEEKVAPQLSIPTKKQRSADVAKPLSNAEHHYVSANTTANLRSQSSLHFTAAGQMIFDATIVALFALIPLSSTRQAWSRSIVCLVSIAWASIASIGIQDTANPSFEITHRPVGLYKLGAYGADESSFSDEKVSSIKNDMCERMSGLIKACKTFDVECNKAIAAVQEVELISRGFKLSHPLPPISRIEANNPIVSPARLRNGSWAGATSHLSAARLSRSSSGGASAMSNLKHHGTRPQTIIVNSTVVSPINGRSSPMEADLDRIRMASLRKGLIVSFEDATNALQAAMVGLAPLIDKAEMKVLEEMYEVNKSQEERSVESTIGRLPSPAIRSATEKRSSWVPLARLRLDDDVNTSSSFDEGDRPATPQRFSTHLENSSVTSSARKRDSGMSETWSVASPPRESHHVRGGSRLGYVSDRGKSITPNQTAESKRLSYISSATSATSPLTSKPFLLQQQSAPAVAPSVHRKRASLLQSGILDDLKQASSPVSYGYNTPAKANSPEAYLISSLKTAFEKVHSLRKEVLCHFLALDFTLDRAGADTGSSTDYWKTVSQIVRQLTKAMQRLSDDCSLRVEKEMGLGQHGNSGNIASLPASPDKSSQDCTGVEDRIAAMGLMLRSIQVKMLVCAEDLKVKSPPGLHGVSTALPCEDSDSSIASGYEKSEKIFETIRDDLLTLSAEWENALKIMQSHSVVGMGDTTSSTLSSSRLDSPQEAEEDALRQWIQARRGENEASDSEDERAASRLIESGLLQWSGLSGDRDDKWGDDHINLSDLLVKTATPDNLPPPGLEKVYESIGGQAEAKRQRSALSREERIKAAKLERAAANEKPTTDKNLDAPLVIMEELQAVMKNRKSLREVENGSNGDMKAGLHSIPHIPSSHEIDHEPSIDDRQAAFAF